MTRREERSLGEIGIDEGLLTRAQIDECLSRQESESAYRPLGAILIERGYLEPHHLHTILQLQLDRITPNERIERKRENDRIFSRICLSRDLIGLDAINECLKVQGRKRRKGVFIPLSRLLIQKGYLQVDQVRELYKIQYGAVFFCESCQVSYQIPDYTEGKAYRCPKCDLALEFQDIRRDGIPGGDGSGGLGLDPVIRPGGEVRLGRFRVISELGRGAMGQVFLAHDERQQEEVALKVLPAAAGLQADTVARFQREAEAIREIDHPGIIPIYEIGQEAAVHYFTMKYIAGGSLDRMIDEERVDPDHACRMIIQAAEALERAHRHEIVHRDIKPENLIHEEETDQVIVTDFGLAKPARAATLTASEAIVGTPCYMSPEQARGKKSLIDHRTDIYSLGATLYELLTYQIPFEGDDVQEILRKVVEENPDPPRKIDSRIPRDLESIVLMAMAKRPGRRYQTMMEFASDLKLYLRGRKVRAKPLNLPARVFRFLYRHREVVVVFLLVQTLVLTIGLFALYRNRQVENRRILEEERGRRDELEAEVVSLRALLKDSRNGSDSLPGGTGSGGGASAMAPLERIREALYRLEESGSLEPDDPVALSARVHLYSLFGGGLPVEAAQREFERAALACRQGPAGAPLERFGLEIVRICRLREELRGEGEGGWALVVEAIDRLMEGQGEAALEAIVAARRIFEGKPFADGMPEGAAVWLDLFESRALEACSRLSLAVEVLDRALVGDPFHPLVLLAWARLTVQVEPSSESSRLEALAVVDRALETAPGFLDARFERVRLLGWLERMEEGRRELERVEVDAPDHPVLPALRRLLRVDHE